MKSLEHWIDELARAKRYLDWLEEIRPRLLHRPDPTFLPNEFLRTMPADWEARLLSNNRPRVTKAEVRWHVRRWWRRERQKTIARVAYCDEQKVRRGGVVKTVWDHLGKL